MMPGVIRMKAMMNPIRVGVVAVLVFASMSLADSRDSKVWTLTTADFRSEPVSIQSLDASGVKIAPAAGGQERTVPMDQFLALHRTLPPTPPSGRFVLHMTGGDQIGGEPLSLTGEALLWKNPSLGEIAIPSGRLVAMTPPDKPAPQDRKREDVVGLANGDTVHGIIASMSPQKITVQTDAGNSDVPMASVASVSFAATPSTATAARGFRVRLDDGSSLVGPQVRLQGDSLVLTLGKNADRKIALAHVETIEQVNGPVSWLSGRTPSQAIHYPFFGTYQGPAERTDRSWTGGPIAFKETTFAHGIGVHAYSRLTWALDGTYRAFRTRFAIDGDSPDADVTVRILLDGKPVFQQPHVRAGVLSPPIVEDLQGAKELTLEVDGGTGYVEDRLNWIEPALLKEKPVEPPPAAATTRPATAPSAGPATAPSTAPATAAPAQ